MKMTVIAALTLALSVSGYAMADEPEPTTPPDPPATDKGADDCLVLSLAGFDLEIGCTQEEIDSVRTRGSSGTF